MHAALRGLDEAREALGAARQRAFAYDTESKQIRG